MIGRKPRVGAGLRSLRRCRGLLHFGPSHNSLHHRFAITCLLRAPSRYIGPRVDKPAPTLAAPPFFFTLPASS